MSSIATNLHSHKSITVSTNVPTIEQDFNRLESIIPSINIEDLNSIKSEKIIRHIVNFLIRLKPSEDGPKIKDADTYLIKLLKIMNKLDEKTDYFNNNTARLNSYNLLVKICNHEYLHGRQDIIDGMYSLIGRDIIWMTYYIKDYKAEYDKYINMICNTAATFNASNHIDPTLAEEIHFNILMSAIEYGNNELINTYCVNIFNFINDSNILELMRVITMKTTPENSVIHLKLICSILETGNLSNLTAKFDILNTFISYCTELLSNYLKYEDKEVVITFIPTILRHLITTIDQKNTSESENNTEVTTVIQQENETITLLIHNIIEKIFNTNINDLLNEINKPISKTSLKSKLNQLIELATILTNEKIYITGITQLVNVLYQRFTSSNPSESHKSYLCNLLRNILENTESLPHLQCDYINEMLSTHTLDDFVDIELETKLEQMTATHENENTTLTLNEDCLIIDTSSIPTNNENNREEQLNNIHVKLNLFNQQLNLINYANNNNIEESSYNGDECKQSNHITPTNGNENYLYIIHRFIPNR